MNFVDRVKRENDGKGRENCAKNLNFLFFFILGVEILRGREINIKLETK